MLWAVDEVVQKYSQASGRLGDWYTSYVNERCLDQQFCRVPLGQVIDDIIAGKSVLGVNEPATTGEYGVLKVSAVGRNGFDGLEHKRLICQDDFMPRFAVSAGDFLITRCNTKELVGRVCIVLESYPSLMLCDKTIKLVFARDKIEPGYLEAILRSRELRVQIEARATGTGGGMKNISQDDIRSLIVPMPTIREQKRLIHELEQGAIANVTIETAAQKAGDLHSRFINSIVDSPL
ncbi:MAG: hypothetical protein NVS2B16_26370 [Chloroflexota bacterium]